MYIIKYKRFTLNDVHRFNVYTHSYEKTDLGLSKVPSTVVLLAPFFLLHCLYKSSVINKSAILRKIQYAHTAYLHLNNVRSFHVKVVEVFSLARGKVSAKTKEIN